MRAGRCWARCGLLADPARGHPGRGRLSAHRGQLSVAATLRAMVRSGNGSLALVELKAVDSAYPMLGELMLEPQMPVAELLAERQDAAGKCSAPLRIRIPAGAARLKRSVTSSASAAPAFKSAASSMPNRTNSAGGLGLGPRFLIREAGCAPPGCCNRALVRWIYRVNLPNDNTSDMRR